MNKVLKTLHLGSCQIFMLQFIDYIKKNETAYEHVFLNECTDNKNNKFFKNIRLFFDYNFKHGPRAEQILVHGIFSIKLIVILIANPFLWKKLVWVIWGGDVYDYRRDRSTFRSHVYFNLKTFLVKKIPKAISGTSGDLKLAEQWYGYNGSYVNCIVYPNSIFRNHTSKNEKQYGLKILVGNSATQNNHHEYILRQLADLDDKKMKVFCPLAYGDKAIQKEITILGKKLFGERFHAITEMQDFAFYQKFLSTVDIAIFNHDRQQGMGTIRALLGFGKKVFMRESTTSYEYLVSKKIKVFNIDSLDLDPHFIESGHNSLIIADLYSEESYRKCLCQALNFKWR